MVGQGKSARLLHGLKVNDIPMAEMRTRPSVITKSMIVDPFQVVDQAVGLDDKLLADDLIFLFILEVSNEDPVDAISYFTGSGRYTKR